MSDTMDRIAALYTPLSVKIEVSEWADENGPLVIYSDPWTIYDERQLGTQLSEDNPEVWVSILIRKACDVKGNKLFTLEDKPKLLRTAKGYIIKRIATQILASVEDQETLAKN